MTITLHKAPSFTRRLDGAAAESPRAELAAACCAFSAVSTG